MARERFQGYPRVIWMLLKYHIWNMNHLKKKNKTMRLEIEKLLDFLSYHNRNLNWYLNQLPDLQTYQKRNYYLNQLLEMN